MTDILDRIRNRVHDAPMTAEYLLDDAGDAIADLRLILSVALAKLDAVQDDGPEGEGWQSDELKSLIRRGHAALEQRPAQPKVDR